MKVNAKSYPHPVLGNGDDLGGHFKVELPYELSRESVTLFPSFNLKNGGIEDLVRKSKAAFIIEVECRSTFYRKSFRSQNAQEKIAIPAHLLRERVTVNFYVCATQDLKDYLPTEAHPDYQNAIFNIDSGDILAVGGQSSFIAEKAFDPLRPPVSSFMSIMEGAHHEGPMSVEYESEKIMIVLSKDDWKNYLAVRGQKPVQAILHSAIVLPTLVDAIYKIQNHSEEYENFSWHGRLKNILETKRLEEKEPFEAAQKVLDNPATRGLRGVNVLISSEAEDDYE